MENNIRVSIKYLSKKAKCPQYGYPSDNCCDLYSVEDIFIPPGERRLVPTGISIKMPPGFGAHIHARSGNAWKKGLEVLNGPGQVDNDYTGEIKVILHNTDRNPAYINVGDAVAQMSFHPVYTAFFEVVDELPSSDRGANGFGSTDVVG